MASSAADSKPAIATNGAGVISKEGGLGARDVSSAEYSEKHHYDPETLEIDHVAEKKLVRKLDLFIVPPVMLLYLFVSKIERNQCLTWGVFVSGEPLDHCTH
jgi:hypothetical protein